MTARAHRFRFGPFELDVKLDELRRDGVRLPLHGQPLQVLALLLQSPRELVSREQLRLALWSDGTVVEFDASLNNCVRRLRQVLGDDATRPTYVETIPRRGYRFVAHVDPDIVDRPLELVRTFDQPAPAPQLPSPMKPRPALPRWARLSLVACTLLVPAGLLTGLAPSLAARWHAGRGSGALAPRRVLAVLPPRDVNTASDTHWIGIALAEGLVAELRAVPDRVRAVDAWRQLLREIPGPDLEGFGANPRRARALLGADLLLMGEYRGAADPGGPLQVTLRLMNPLTGKQLSEWTENGTTVDLPQIVRRLGAHARDVIGAPAPPAELSGGVAAATPRVPEAARLHAQGLLSVARSDFAAAVRDLQAAVALDQDAAAALDLASAYWELGEGRQARKWAERGLEHAGASGATERIEAALRVSDYAHPSADVVRQLWQRWPDEPAYVFSVAERDPPRAALVTLARFRASGSALSQGPWVDFVEGKVQRKAGNDREADRLFDSARQKAELLGAMGVLGHIFLEQGYIERDRNRPAEALAKFAEAASFASKVDDPLSIVRAQLEMALVERDRGELRASERVFEEALAGARRLGSRRLLHDLLSGLSWQLYLEGRVDAATDAMQQASEELRLAGESPLSEDLADQAFLAIERADPKAARELIRESAAAAVSEGTAPVPFVEELLLVQQDHLREARAMYQRVSQQASSGYQHLDAVEARSRVGWVDCELGHPREGMAEIAETLSEERTSSLFVGFNRALFGYCLLLVGDYAGAERVAAEGVAASERGGRFYWRLMNAANLAKARAGLGHVEEGIKSLKGLVAEAQSRHGRTTAFEMSLALGLVEHRAGRREGTARLLRLEQQARSTGWFRIARMAREALAEKSSPKWATAQDSAAQSSEER